MIDIYVRVGSQICHEIVAIWSGFLRDVLDAIDGLENPKGLAIKDEMDEYHSSEINHGRLYPNLDTLVEKGLVDKGKIDDRTNQYSLTIRGRREIEALREWEDAYVEGVVEEAA